MSAETAARVTRLRLTRFRSYDALDLDAESAEGIVVLLGPNGSGKTNILEALSLLAPGRGLRRADPADLPTQGRDGSFGVSVEAVGALGAVQLGTGQDPLVEGEVPGPRRCRVDRAAVGSAAAFAEHLRPLWLTPAMDGLFSAPASERRRFLDRLVLAIDAGHGTRVNALERALRNRNRLLEDGGEARWLEAAERELADLAVAVAAARADTVRRLSALIEEDADPGSPFPFARLSLDGPMEAAVLSDPALAVEEAYRRSLRDTRGRDRAAGRTLEGPHRTDLRVTHGPKAIPAERASTGEQKALLIGLVLAHAALVARLSGCWPILLLDEVAAHLDPLRRAALYDRLDETGAQVWLTGADAAVFAAAAGRAHLYDVSPGRVVPAG